MTIALIITGGNGTRYIYFLSLYEHHAASSVAREPKMTSSKPPPNPIVMPTIFVMRQPINSPGIALGKTAGSTVSASANRI